MSYEGKRISSYYDDEAVRFSSQLIDTWMLNTRVSSDIIYTVKGNASVCKVRKKERTGLSFYIRMFSFNR